MYFFLLLFWLLPALLTAQPKDSVVSTIDSLKPVALKDTPAFILLNNRFIRDTIIAEQYPVVIKQRTDKDYLFYLLAATALLLALLRFFFARYFDTLFRVFFNTSLRQSQLTDQLLQAKLPSLLFNLFFLLSGGLYVYFLLQYNQVIQYQNKWLLMAGCVSLVSVIYGMKFLVLKFTGWLTGDGEIITRYVFIVFLINKIIGILMLPFLFVLAFSETAIVNIAIGFSVILSAFLFLLRFFRCYGLVRNNLKVSRVHFFLLVIALEVLPLLLIYKALLLLLSKNL